MDGLRRNLQQSGETTATYVAPNAVGNATITATSIADVTKSASANIGVTDLAGVTTYHNNPSRDGVNSREFALTTANVKTSTFGKLFSCPVDGEVYAQPLWMPNLAIGGGTHNVVFVATQNDSIYAFDADASPCHQYWQRSFLRAGVTQFPSQTRERRYQQDSRNHGYAGDRSRDQHTVCDSQNQGGHGELSPASICRQFG